MASSRSSSNPSQSDSRISKDGSESKLQRPQIVRSATSTRSSMSGSTTRLRSRSLINPAGASGSGNANASGHGTSSLDVGSSSKASAASRPGSSRIPYRENLYAGPTTLKIASAVSDAISGLGMGTPLSPIPATPVYSDMSGGEHSDKSPSFGRESCSSSTVSEYDTPPQTPRDEEAPMSSGFLHPGRSSLNLYLPQSIPISHDAKGKGKQMPQPFRQPSFVSIVMPQTPAAVKTEYEAHAGLPSQHVSRAYGQTASSQLGHKRPNSLSQHQGNTVASADQAQSDTDALPGPLGGQATVYNFAKPIVILGVLFVASTATVVFLISTVPTLHLPKTLADVVDQANALRHYSRTSSTASMHIFLVLSCMFVWKQAFSIPGSLITNILFGSLYGVFTSTIITSILTAVGSLLCYFMARKTSPLVRYLMPKPLAFMQANIDKRTANSADLFSYLLLLRLFPLLPYSALNIAGGVLNVPPLPFFWTLVLGSIPFNAVTTQVGDLLASIPLQEAGSATGSLTSIWTPALLFKLLIISLVSALPVLFKSQITHFLGGDLHSETSSDSMEMRDNHSITRRTASLEDGSDDESDISKQRDVSRSDTSMDGTEAPLLPVGLSSTYPNHKYWR